MNTFYIQVRNRFSRFARTLQRALQARINYKVKVVDHPTKASKTFVVTLHPANKVEQLTLFKKSNVSCPIFVTNSTELDSFGKCTWFVRTRINSSGGKGIVEFNYTNERDIPAALLYTQYIRKAAEYRVHIFADTIIDTQQKKKRRNFQRKHHPTIWNLKNGYIYTRNGITDDPRIGQLGLDAVKALGYTYGAVDIIYNAEQDKYFVLEVNSKPGLTGITLEKYVGAIITAYNLTRD